MKIPLLAALATAMIAAGPAFAEPQPDVTGFWQVADSDGNVSAWFYFIEKFQHYEGRLAKMFVKPGTPVIATCSKCTGEQANAPMLGLVIVKKMSRYGLKYEDGSILDPRDGSVYHAQMELSADGQELSVRGYLGIPALGQTQVWTRLPDNAMPHKDIPRESVSPHLKVATPD
jgi:uncharacterized protein (DUF2147 family)